MISALLTMVSFAHADNFIKVESPAEVPQGGTGFIEVLFNFDQDNYFANYSFDFYLPEGITLNTKEIIKGECHSENHDKYTVTQNEGYYTLSMLSVPTSALTGTSGILVKLAVNVDKELALDSEFDGSIKRIRFASTGGTSTAFDDIDFKIKIVEKIITLDENSTKAPEAEEDVKVQVLRTIKAGNWNTLCLPFDMDASQVKAAFGDDVELAEFTGWSWEEDDDAEMRAITINFTSCSAISENVPLIIKTKEDITSFIVDEVTINPDDAEVTIKESVDNKRKGTMIGTYVANTVLDEDMLFLSGNKFYYSTGKTKMKAFRAYFDLYYTISDEYKTKVSASNVKILVDGEATSIDGYGVQRVVEGVYDLSGRKIKLENGDVSKLQKGVYIIDGKKVTIK